MTIDGPALVTLAFGATYGPSIYRELPGALRSALAGNRAPLLRLVAEDDFPSGGVDDAVDYSEGLDAAVSCHDYPQLYDMTSPVAARKTQYAAAVSAEQQHRPGVYGPFTISEYLRSDWEEQDWCLQWPIASAGHPAGPPAPPSGHYPSTPTLVLSGELDSITTPAEGSIVASHFPAARQVIVSNSFHVTALGDTDGCAVRVLRAFVAQAENRCHRKHFGLHHADPSGPRGRAVRHLDGERNGAHRRLQATERVALPRRAATVALEHRGRHRRPLVRQLQRLRRRPLWRELGLLR